MAPVYLRIPRQDTAHPGDDIIRITQQDYGGRHHAVRIGGTVSQRARFIRISGIRAACESLTTRVNVVMPLEKKWYGPTEFACTDPDGYVITFAEQEP
jgi:uncharacterized glyoxalase superfamily protein PhnB